MNAQIFKINEMIKFKLQKKILKNDCFQAIMQII